VEQHYAEYIREKSTAWAASSVRSESQRLNRFIHLVDGDAAKLFAALQELGSYSRQTYWTRASAYWDWLIETGKAQAPNPYATWIAKNRRVFANAYVRKPCPVTFDEAWALLDRIGAEDLRNGAKVLLWAGLRWCEIHTITPDGYVTGKGGKVRKVYLPPEAAGPLPGRNRYSAILRELKKLGLRPHKLRSIRMSNLVERGANVFELKAYAGWSDLKVAESYVIAREQRIQALVQEPRRTRRWPALMNLFGK
jgi:hypothetical protein